MTCLSMPDFGRLDTPPRAWPARRPLRIALLGDFSGRGATPGGRPIAVEADTLDGVMARLAPSITVPLGEGGHAVALSPTDLDAFHPDPLVRTVPALQTLLNLKKRLASPATFAKAAAEVQKWTGGSRRKPSRVARAARVPAPAPVAGGIDALLRDIVSPFVEPAARPEQAALQATVEAALSDALRALLHHSAMQAAEALWRGLDFLLRRLDTGATLQVHLFDVGFDALSADLGAPDLAGSALYRSLVQEPSTVKDGGYAWIGGLYRFEATAAHAALLGRLARIAAAAGARFVTEAPVEAFADPRRAPPALPAWAALQALPEAAQLLLAGPRFLLRHPYGRRSDPVSSFAFEEFTAAEGLSGLLWGHPAWAVLAAAVGQGGRPLLGDLPVHHFVDADGECTALPCTDRLIGPEVAAHLARQRFVALAAERGAPQLRLVGLPGGPGTTAAPKAASFVFQAPAATAPVAATPEAVPESTPDTEPEDDVADTTMDPELQALLDSLNA